MAKRKPSKPYSDAILTPAPKYDPNASGAENALRWQKSAAAKLDALMDHYGIERNEEGRWALLAFILAYDFVPGFAPSPSKDPRGRPVKPSKMVDDLMLVSELGEAERQKKSVKNKARLLTLNDKRFKGQNAENLRQRYMLLKRLDSPEHKRLRVFKKFILTSTNSPKK